MAPRESRRVAPDEAGLRLDRWFRRHFPQLGHGRLEKLLRTGQVRLDGKRVKAGARLEPGQTIRVPPQLQTDADLAPAPRSESPLRLSPDEQALLMDSVLYQDDWILALNKPAGLAVQGGSRQKRHLDAMLDALRFGADERPRLVHRLDKDTSGVLLLARSRAAAQALTAAFRDQATEKTYWAAVAGVPRPESGRIDLPLGKARSGGRERMSSGAPAERQALTLYALAGRWRDEVSWLVLRPLTGRTHQLRVHCAAIGHPILGDGKYGGKAAFPASLPRVKRLHLHAREIALLHPEQETTLRVTAPLPAHMEQTWTELGFRLAAGQDAQDSLPG